MKFNSQICTSTEQSKRLLALGLKPETADMCHFCSTNDDVENPYTRMVVEDYIDIPLEDNNEDIIPAWSLHRLMELYSCVEDTSSLCIKDISYKLLIFCIEKAIHCGFFNKEYLNK